MHLKSTSCISASISVCFVGGGGLGIKFDIWLETEPFCLHTVIRQTGKTTDLSVGEYTPSSLGNCSCLQRLRNGWLNFLFVA